MKRILFIDRDGTIILEPADRQIDSLEKLEFYPGVISALGRIARETDFELVMVTNQDGLGTESFPEPTFWPAHNKMLTILAGEGVEFADILIDRSMPEDEADTRKPRLGMMGKYMAGDFDLAHSFVIGDRQTDLEFAKNLSVKAIMLGPQEYEDAVLCTTDWDAIYRFLRFKQRKASIDRQTSETSIRVAINLDGKGRYAIETGLGFFDHMLQQLARHSGCDIEITAKGDLNVDEHHTIEDTAIALGEAFSKALGDKRGITRYGFMLPMDDAIVHLSVDFSGRSWVNWDVEFRREYVGDMPTEMVFHFFKSFADAVGANIFVKAEGQNEHHKIEAIFKAFGRTIKQAVAIDPASNDIPSTKGRI